MSELKTIPDEVIEYVKTRMALKDKSDAEKEIKTRCAALEDLYFQGGSKVLWTDIDRRIIWLLAKNGVKEMHSASKDLKKFDDELKKAGAKVWSGVLSNLEFFVSYCFQDVKFDQFKKTCSKFLTQGYTSEQVQVFANLLKRGSELCGAGGLDNIASCNDFAGLCITEALKVTSKAPEKLRSVARNRLNVISKYVARLAVDRQESDAGFE
jgi:hypothetical protein